VRIDVLLQVFSTCALLAAQLALQIAWVKGLFGIFESKHLFVGETLHHHFQFPPSLDASAQVLLHRGHGGKLFVAQLALVISVIFYSTTSSESGNVISGDELWGLFNTQNNILTTKLSVCMQFTSRFCYIFNSHKYICEY
jgi:hypothetical protein